MVTKLLYCFAISCNKQINKSSRVLFLPIPESTRIENTKIKKLAGPSAKFHSTKIHQNDQIPAGIGDTAKTSFKHVKLSSTR